MPIDFNRLSGRNDVSGLTAPRDIFNALPEKAPGLGYLRDVQGQVLDAWDKRRMERDVPIKMNTGTGKTLVGLLILRSCLNEGVGPALYVSPDNYLTEQVCAQSAKLSIATTTDPESHGYLAGRAIGVVNISKLVNGRSVFGGPGSTRATPIPIGAVVVDDAHAAVAATEAQCTLQLPSTHPAFGELLSLFREDLQRQSQTAFLDIEANEPTATLRAPFWAWADKGDDVARILHAHRDDPELRFVWPLLSPTMAINVAVFSGRGVEVKPPCPLIGSIESFRTAARRVYLTATLADDSVLVTHFDADPDRVGDPITPTSAADLGDRLILAPQEINPRIAEHEVVTAIRYLADRENTVVLVPSYRRAEVWQGVADITTGAEGIANAVERLQGGHVGLVVLVNKYDGVDLPDDACRVLVIDGLPEAYGLVDRREATLLNRTDAMVGRQLQRVEQGMGRGVRSADDYCVVLLLGSRLSQLIAQPANAARLGPATSAQLQLSRQVATELEGSSMDEVVAVMNQSLARDSGWIAASRSALQAFHTVGPRSSRARYTGDVHLMQPRSGRVPSHATK